MHIKEIQNILRNKEILSISILWLFFFCANLFIVICNGQRVDYLFDIGRIAIQIVSASLIIVLYYKCREKSFEEFIKSVVFISICQSIISLLAFFVPSIKCIICEIALNNNEALRELIEFYREFRYYGLADNLFFATPILQGTIGMIALYYYLESKERLFLQAFVLDTITGALNARTTYIVIAACGCILLLTAIRKRYIKILSQSIIAWVSVYGVVMVWAYFFSPYDLRLVFDFVKAIMGQLVGKTVEGEYFDLINDFTLQTAQNYSTSTVEIGYLICVNNMGVVMTILLWGICLYMLYLAHKKLEEKHKIVVVLLGVSLLVAGIKGLIIAYNAYTIILFAICFMSYWQKE